MEELFCIGYTIKEATAKLERLLGGKFYSIRMHLVFPADRPSETKWSIYDGITESLHEASTLRDATNKCMIAIVDHEN